MFKKDDFVQVEHAVRNEDGTIEIVWLNALYMGKHNGNHCVVYSDNRCQQLHDGIKIRMASGL